MAAFLISSVARPVAFSTSFLTGGNVRLRQYKSHASAQAAPRFSVHADHTFEFSVAAPPAPSVDMEDPDTHFKLMREGVKKPASESVLTPRFYTTNFDEIANMDISANLEEILAINEEFRMDYNRDHFVRDESFNTTFDHIDGERRKLFVEFLERSCTAEFSGFLLYKEIERKIKKRNPVLAESFALMARDEARHAGFINKALSDFHLQLDLGYLTKNRSYTFFEPKFIIYATYLSEKIGYWRYITIFKHFEQNPQDMIYPLFKYFEEWCQDENRHGDFLDALLRSQRSWLDGLQSKLWCRFFLLSVFATMYLNDLQRAGFYGSLGIDARSYDKEVIIKTNETAAKVFPVILDVAKPAFFEIMEECAQKNLRVADIDTELNELPSGLGSAAKKLALNLEKKALQSGMVIDLARLYMMKPIDVTANWGHAH